MCIIAKLCVISCVRLSLQAIEYDEWDYVNCVYGDRDSLQIVRHTHCKVTQCVWSFAWVYVFL